MAVDDEIGFDTFSNDLRSRSEYDDKNEHVKDSDDDIRMRDVTFTNGVNNLNIERVDVANTRTAETDITFTIIQNKSNFNDRQIQKEMSSAFDPSYIDDANVEYFDPSNYDGLDVANPCNTKKDVIFAKIPNVIHSNDPIMKEPSVAPEASNTAKTVSKSKVHLPITGHDKFKQIDNIFLAEDISIDGSDTPLEKSMVNYC